MSAAGGELRDGPDRKAPLTGVRVVELASYLTGPFAAMMLGQLGAEVVKVESPRGDPFRRFGRPDTEYSAFFATCNRGKRSVVIDLQSPEGATTVLRLVAGADILICNWRPGVADRLGLGDAALRRVNEQLIRIYISGYGPDGPRSREPAFDAVVQAQSGLTRALSASDEPVLVPGYPIDKLTGVMAVQAALAALFSRERNGSGDRIDLAMLDAAGYLNFVDLYANRVLVDSQPADPRNLSSIAVRPIEASDGWLVVAPVSVAAIRGACQAVGHDEWVEEVLAVRDPAGLVEMMFDRLETVTRTRTVATWVARFSEHDVPAAPCLSIDEHFADAQVRHNELYELVDWPDVGRIRGPRYPARFESVGTPQVTAPAPLLGADTEQLLLELDGANGSLQGDAHNEETAAT